MQVSVEMPSKLERRVTVIVPSEQVDQAYDKRISQLLKTAKIDGFRKGKVPLSYVQQRFGEVERQKALSEVIQTSFYAAITQEKLSPVSVPTIEPKTVLAGQPLEFVATFEVLPAIEAIKFELKKLEKQIVKVMPADIEKVIERLCAQHITWKPIDRSSQLKDQLKIDFRGSIDGTEFAGGQAHDYPIVLGSKTMIPGFEEQLIGLKTGETKTLHVTFPENYFAKEFAGKAAEFAVKVISVSEPALPPLDESLVKKLGIKSGNIEDLRTEIQKNLEREAERLVKTKLKNQVFDHLLKQNTLEIPKALIDREAARIHDELHRHPPGHDHKHSDAEMAAYTQSAERNVALGLLLAEVMKQHKITVDGEKLQTYITQLASNYEKPEEVMKWYTTNQQARSELEMQIIEEQVVEKLLEGVQMTEKMLNYTELLEGTTSHDA